MCLLAICRFLWKHICIGHLPSFDWIILLFFLVLSFISCLYILNVKFLSVISFANIFSHFGGYLFIVLMISFAVSNLLGLIRYHLFSFCFYFFYIR